jgi:hypothetical protein
VPDQDPFKTLGVLPTASKEEIKRAFREVRGIFYAWLSVNATSALRVLTADVHVRAYLEHCNVDVRMV